VTATTSGVVQNVSVETGQRVSTGAELTRIAAQHDLKAVLLVPEADARNVTVGLAASVDSGSGPVRGRVVRIDPSAQNGTVAVDIGFEGRTILGARPDLHVDGTIEVDRVPNALSVSRPAGTADDSETELYKIAGDRAVRARVRFGRGSADRVRILSGLRAGDDVIISDTSSFNGAPLVQLR
jgi:multidrug efflux pump subunit AcrA (membrane-fusion protein)